MNIDKICEQLTIDEKIRLLGGVGDWHTYDCNTVYDSYQDVVNVSMFGKFVRGVVHIGLKIMLRGKSEQDPAFKMVKMGVEEGNLEGLIATSGGIATPKLIDMLVYNANKKYLQAFKRLLKK